MRAFTTRGIANAIRAGIRANFAPPYQADELDRLSELFLDMAASIEMVNVDTKTGLPADKKQSMYSTILGELGWMLDAAQEEKRHGSVGTGAAG